MESVLLLAKTANKRTEYLTSIIDAAYHIEIMADVDQAMDEIRKRAESIFALIIDNPSGMDRADELTAYVTGANSYLSAIPVLVLTDPEHRDDDEAYLSDTVISAIETGQSARSVLQSIRKANDTINSFSFHEFSRMLKALPSLIYLKDAKGRYVFCSQYWPHLAYCNVDDWTIRGKTDIEIRKDGENARAAFESDMRIIESGKGMSYVIEENGGGIREFLQIIKEPVRNEEGKVSGIIAIINNVTEQETLRRELKRKSITDELTGLYNRVYFDEYIASLPEDIYPLGVVSADCDGLKAINDLYGHPVGDEYIRMAATLLKTVLAEDSVIFRMGGDEFLALLPRTGDPDIRKYTAQLAETQRIFSIKDRPLSVSFGVSVTRGSADSLMDAVAESDRDMYRNKRAKDSWI